MRITFAAVSAMILAACAGTQSPYAAERSGTVNFADVDANGDSYIDKQELEQYIEKMRENARSRFPGGQRGGSGRQGDRIAQLYEESDADGDGLLDEEEFKVFQESMRSMRERMRQRWAERRGAD